MQHPYDIGPIVLIFQILPILINKLISCTDTEFEVLNLDLVLMQNGMSFIRGYTDI